MNEKAETNKWKPKLLSSSVPMEYDAARVLVDAGFSIYADDSYHRLVDGHAKEFSIDVRATRVTPPIHSAKRGCLFDLLVECKHRTRPAVWLFIPEPKRRPPREYEVVRGVEEFSPWSLVDALWWTEEIDLPNCYKAVEINLSNGAVETSELRHGFLQLQFAIPALLRMRFDMPATSLGVSENTPLLFSTLLVTNAPIMVATRKFGSEEVEGAETLSDLAQDVPAVMMRVPPGRDFYQHAALQFHGFPQIAARKGIQAAEAHRKKEGIHSWDLPTSLALRLASDGAEFETLTNVEYILVCRFGHFPQLVAKVNEIANRVAASATLNRPEYLRR